MSQVDERVIAPATLPQLFQNSVKSFGSNVMMWEKRGSPEYRGTTYTKAELDVRRFTAGLLALGVKKGDRLALISEGRNDWVTAELGILHSGAVNVPISVRIEEVSELRFRLNHSGCRLAVVSRGQLEKIRRAGADLAEMERIICLDDIEDPRPDEMTREELLLLGDRFLIDKPDVFTRRWQSVQPDDPATISYTSGTTADPKGIMLSHKNYICNIGQGAALVKAGPQDRILLILPWDHAFAHTCGIYIMMRNGASFASVQQGRTVLETLKNIPGNLREFKPTILLSAPALARNFRKNIEKSIRDKGPKVEAMFNHALRLAYAYNAEGHNRGRARQVLKKPLLAIYDRILFSKIRRAFGGRLKFFIGGAALLDIDMQRFFYAVGLPMFQGYGLTEAAPVISANSLERHKLGSSGLPVPDLELRICDEKGKALPAGEKGEIVVKGDNVMLGYWRNEEATREVLRDGWLHTGDLGYLDKDGFLYVLGRFKSLLIGNDGEKYSPEGIEEALAEHCPSIEQIMLHNNQDPYTVALVVPNRENLVGRVREAGLSLRELPGQQEALQLIAHDIEHFREQGPYAGVFPGRWLPAAVAVLGEPFSEQNRMLNSTMKMVRSRITEYYRNRIDYLYTPEGKPPVNPQNLVIVSRWGESA